MRAGVLGTIAGKEFRDHVRSRRFHLFLGVMLVIVVAGMVTGAAQYSADLAAYAETQAVVSGESGPSGGGPSVLSFFSGMFMSTAQVGVFLGIAMGFDLVTREKESKSLKILLSHPVYRDEVVTGKALGGVAAIALAMGVVLLLSLAVLLVFGIVPGPGEALRVLAAALISFVLVVSFFVLALFFSTVAETSGGALVSSFLVFIIVAEVVPVLTVGAGSSLLTGPHPSPPAESGDIVSDEEMEAYEEASRAYTERMRLVRDAGVLLSPQTNCKGILGAVTTPGVPVPPDFARNIVAFAVFPAAFFGLAWVRFLREDIR
ncbi:ABC transporter permease [Methanofollis sp. UBA420]|uniref:ABC transporter permease n=1 Tax=Methanofollis sp. UBA420 TaxID=1915514 RepID=UPI00316AC32D